MSRAYEIFKKKNLQYFCCMKSMILLDSNNILFVYSKTFPKYIIISIHSALEMVFFNGFRCSFLFLSIVSGSVVEFLLSLLLVTLSIIRFHFKSFQQTLHEEQKIIDLHFVAFTHLVYIIFYQILYHVFNIFQANILYFILTSSLDVLCIVSILLLLPLPSPRLQPPTLIFLASIIAFSFVIF